MSLLLEMFTYPFIVRAFVVGILVSLCAALLGARAALSVQHGKLSAFFGRVYSRRFQLTEQRFAQIRPLSFHRSFPSRAFPLGLSFRTSVQHQDKSGSAATVDSHSPCVPAAP